MPESVTDRPTSATEKVFLLTKSERYFYDAEAVKEETETRLQQRLTSTAEQPKGALRAAAGVQNGPQGGISTSRNMRNWWLLGPEPFAEAHFATFPTEIPRRAILAGTSERGVCPKCGAPWARVTETSYEQSEQRTGSTGGRRREAAPRDAREDRLPNLLRYDKTIGWRPTCGCADGGEPRPAVVLDPFFGAGTTGLVADQLQRDCIGIEINPNYAQMTQRRIEADAPLFSQMTIA
jgi:hypothetical protein